MSGTQSRFQNTQQATTDANGYCTFVFSPPPAGQMLTTSVSVTDSPANVQWTMYLGAAPTAGSDSVPGIATASTLGPNIIYGVQQSQQQYLVVQASGISGTPTYSCTQQGWYDTAANVPLEYPVNLSQAISASISTGTVDATITGPVTIGGGTIDANITGGTIDIASGTVNVNEIAPGNTIASQAILLSTTTTPVSDGAQRTVSGVPSWVQQIVLAAPSIASTSNGWFCNLSGATTGLTYWSSYDSDGTNLISSYKQFASFYIAPGLDTTFTLTFRMQNLNSPANTPLYVMGYGQDSGFDVFEACPWSVYCGTNSASGTVGIGPVTSSPIAPYYQISNITLYGSTDTGGAGGWYATIAPYNNGSGATEQVARSYSPVAGVPLAPTSVDFNPPVFCIGLNPGSVITDWVPLNLTCSTADVFTTVNLTARRVG